MRLKKILSLLTVMAMLLSSVSFTVFAEDGVTDDTSVDAIETMEELEEAVLTGNSEITVSGVLTVAEGETHNLDLNGCTVYMGSNYIENNGTLTVTNGTIIADTFNNDTNGAPLCNKGELTVYGNIEISGVCSAIRNVSGACVIESGTLNATCTLGYSASIIRMKGGSLTINGGSFNGCNDVNPNEGCSILSADDGETVINGGTFNNFAGSPKSIFGKGVSVTVKGGTFNFENQQDGFTYQDCLKDYLADGYEVNADGTVATTYVAYIDGQGYKSVQAAIDAAQEDDIVTIAAGEYEPIDICSKNITIQGTVGDDGELLTTIKGGDPAIKGHSFNGTIRDIKIVDAWRVMYAEPAGNVTVDNVHVTGATYGFHLVAYSSGLTWKIENSYMDLSWANSFGVSGAGDADIIIKGNEFVSTNPYYPGYGAIHVNSYLPSVTVEENIFRENARIYIDKSVTDTSKIKVSKNYHADGIENAFADDSDGVTVEIDSYYKTVDENGNLTDIVMLPKGELQVAYTSASYVNGVPAIFGEAIGVVATDSFEVKLYSGDKHVGTATLVDDNKVLLNGVSKSVTWHAALSDDGDTWWETTWEDGAINVNAIPDTAKLCVDGVEVDTCAIELNVNDLEKPIFAAVTDESGKVQSFVAGTGYLNGSGSNVPKYDDALKSALKAGGNITLLSDIKLTEDIKIEKTSFTLNGNEHSISGGALWLLNGNYDVKNVVFDTITTTDYGVLQFTYATANVTSCTFTNNNAQNCIAVDTNANKDGTSVVTIDGCTFSENTCSTAIINSAEGTTNVKNSTITGNTANIAVIYNSANFSVTGSVFDNNTLTGENANKAAILTGPWVEGTYNISINENAFMDDAYCAVYVESFVKDSTNNLSGNYWNGGEPEAGIDYKMDEGANVTLDSYYTIYKDGALGNLVTITSDVAQIGDVKYPSLAKAIEAAQDGDTIQLLEGATIEEGEIQLPALKNVTVKGADGASLKNTYLVARTAPISIVGLTIDGVVFDNSNILIVAWGGDIKLSDWTIENSTFKNLNTENNEAPIHLNNDAAYAMHNFTFTNNVIENISGGSKSGFYGAFTGNVIVTDNTFKVDTFRAFIAQIVDNDGIADTLTVENNNVSGPQAWVQTYGSMGTDTVKVNINNNIFSGFDKTYEYHRYINCWNFADDVEHDLSGNYYGGDLAPSNRWGSTTSDESKLAEYGIYPLYTALNDDGTIDLSSAYTYAADVAQIGDVKYPSLAKAIEAAKDAPRTVEIKMINDVEIEATAIIGSIVLDLNGCTIYTTKNIAFQLKKDAELTIKDTSVEQDGLVKVENTTGGRVIDMPNSNTKFMLESGNLWSSEVGICTADSAATVTVKSGSIICDTENKKAAALQILVGSAEVTGGTFSSNVTAYCADGYAALPDLNGNYVVGETPTATVNNLGAMTIPAGEYYIYNGSLTTGTVDMPLNFVMQFVADQNAEDMKTSPYANWYADFVITFDGIEDDSFDPTGCYLAGYYGSTESWDGMWVKIPVDGLLTSIDQGTRYPVMMGVGMAQSYDYICSGVQAFSCAMFIPEEILAANPDLKVNLELNVVDSSDPDKALEALQTGTNIYKASETEYNADVFMGYVAQIGDVKYTSLQEAIKAAVDGNTITLLDNVTVSEKLTLDKNITVDLNEKKLTLATGGNIVKANVTIKNGEIVIADVDTKATGNSNTFISVNVGAELTLDDINMTGNGYTTHWAVLCAMSSSSAGSTLNIKNSTINLANEKGSQGGFIKDQSGTDNYSKINIENSTITLDKVSRGFTGGSVELVGTKLTITGGENGINGSEVVANGSEINISGGSGRALTVTDFNMSFTDTKLTLSDMGEGEIRFKTDGTITVDEKTSTLAECDVYVDSKVKNATINGKAITGTEDEMSTATVANGVTTIVNPTELFDWYGMNLDLESSMKANFYVLASHFEGTDYYAKIVHSSATGDIEHIVDFEDWEDNGSYKQITYTDLAAKNMADTVTITIYDGNGKQVSIDYVRSIKTYAEDYIKAYAGTSDKWVTPFVDMLNYGAEAQKYFDYNTVNLANADIDDYQIYATQDEIELKADVDSSEHVFGANLDLENKIVYNGYFSDVTDDMTAEVSYTDHLGNPITHTAKLLPNGSYHQVSVDTLVIADANQLVTITVKDCNGDVYAFRKESINGYLYRAIQNIPGFEPLGNAMAKFTASAHTALHTK